MKIIQQPELQVSTLALYGEFLCRRDSWSGKLALAAFAGSASTGFAAAASLAGASSLLVDSDTQAMKAHFRDGAFDFIVNTLDEALRAIKNEIRQGRPIAIGLMSEPSSVLRDATERGLAAALVLGHPEADHELLRNVSERDAATIQVDVASTSLSEWLSQRGWSAQEVGGPLPVVEDEVRAKWLRGLPAHQRSVRQGNRWMWISADEQRQIGTQP